jgi:hypothetical protein
MHSWLKMFADLERLPALRSRKSCGPASVSRQPWLAKEAQKLNANFDRLVRT